MYKKLIGIAAVAAMATGIYFVTNSESSDDNNVDLASLLKVNNANAECFPYRDITSAPGYCYTVGAGMTCLIWNSYDCDGGQP